MDDLFDPARAGARELADRITPPSPTTVRARGDRRRHRRAAGATAVAVAGIVAAGGVALAASGSGQHGSTGVPPGTTSTPRVSVPSSAPSAPSSAPSPIVSTSTTPPAGGTTSTPSETATPSSPAAPAACAPDALTVSMTDQIGRTGHTIALLVFQNTGSTLCRLSGYPQVSGVDAAGKTTTTAAHTLSGWAGSQITAIPAVDLAPGGYGSAGIEWRNGTDDGGPCALVADIEVTPPSGASPTRIPVGTPSLTDGPACSGFQVHPVVSGVASGYALEPWLARYELPYASSIRWGAPSAPQTDPASHTTMFVDGAMGCRMFSAPYHGPDATTLKTVVWENGGKDMEERVATESLLTFPTAADAQKAFADAKAGAVAATCHSVAAMNPMTTTVFGTAVSTSNGVSFAQTYVEDGGSADGLRTHLHYYVVYKDAVLAIIQVEGSNSTTDDTTHDAAVLNAMAAHLS